MDNKELYQKIDEIISAHSGEKPIVAILQDIQDEYRYLPANRSTICRKSWV